MKAVHAIALLIILVLAAILLRGPGDERAPALATRDLPWQVEPLANGSSRVFGLELAHSTLDDARMRFGEGMKLGIVAAQGEDGALEAYYDTVTAGVILGKLILVAELDAESLAHLRERSPRREHMNDMTFRYVLAPDDLPVALQAPIVVITFIPAADLDAETVIKRFGTPHERLRAHAHGEHFLYPQWGLDLLIDDEGKEVLQYVAPREFARLRAPLLQDGTPAAPGGAR